MRARIQITWPLCLKWTLLVSLSAVASFAAALLGGYNTSIHIAAMILGIVTFIAIYVAIDGWADANAMVEFRRSLRLAVLTKIGLELIPAIDILSGFSAVQIVESLGIRGIFPSAYLYTIATGTILSIVVAFFVPIYWYYGNRRGTDAQRELGDRV